jgi:hypothetical protein
MAMLEFQVCRRQARWVVRLGSTIYGDYVDREQALLDAVDAAREAAQTGQEAQVWLHEQAVASRVF